jgi:site-specific recombinase XerD
MSNISEMRLFDDTGHRLYINAEEREAFLNAARQLDPEQRTLCEVLCFTGCRITEALELTVDRVDMSSGALIFRTLKKRRQHVYRDVPIPPALLDTLNLVHGIQKTQRSPQGGKGVYLWLSPHSKAKGNQPMTRQGAGKLIKRTMKAAGIEGKQASPKGLRHAYGVRAVMNGVQLDLLQRLMGHADQSVTAIYTQAIGEDKRELVSKIW